MRMINYIIGIILLLMASNAVLAADFSSKNGALNISSDGGSNEPVVNIQHYGANRAVSIYGYNYTTIFPMIAYNRGSNQEESAYLMGNRAGSQATYYFSDRLANSMATMQIRAGNVSKSAYALEIWSANNMSLYTNGTIYGYTISAEHYYTRSKVFKGDALSIIDDFKSNGNCKGDLCDIDHEALPAEATAKYKAPIISTKTDEYGNEFQGITGFTEEKIGGDLEVYTMISIKAIQELKARIEYLEIEVAKLKK